MGSEMCIRDSLLSYRRYFRAVLRLALLLVVIVDHLLLQLVLLRVVLRLTDIHWFSIGIYVVKSLVNATHILNHVLHVQVLGLPTPSASSSTSYIGSRAPQLHFPALGPSG